MRNNCLSNISISDWDVLFFFLTFAFSPKITQKQKGYHWKKWMQSSERVRVLYMEYKLIIDKNMRVVGEKDGIAMQDYNEQERERLVGRGEHEQEEEEEEEEDIVHVPKGKVSHEERANGPWKPPYLAHRESGSRGSYASLADEEV